MNAPTRRKRLQDPVTKAKILAAAQEAFAEHGYVGAAMRDIGMRAGVSAPLLLRYFESKAALFEAALSEALPVERVFDMPNRHTFGTLLAEIIHDAMVGRQSASIIALCIGDEQTREIARRITEERLLEPLSEWLGGTNARDRAIEILMLSLGFLVYTQHIPLSQEGSAPRKRLTAWFAKSIQAVVDGASNKRK
jgi:AcrR family transcriptional regulator